MTGAPIGAVLAGGGGRRLGGDKACVQLAGRPLLWYPGQALQAVLEDVAVVAKPGTCLPQVDGLAVWREPPEPSHPLAGIVHALRRGAGRPVVVCAVDLPLVSPDLVRALARAASGGAPAVVPRAGGRLQPLLARYEPAALGRLGARGLAGPLVDAPLTDVVRALEPRIVELADSRAFFNVNTPDDLREAERLLAQAQ
jgi:molybdopterin-guanine dinucleotide biosynthesis protein A